MQNKWNFTNHWDQDQHFSHWGDAYKQELTIGEKVSHFSMALYKCLVQSYDVVLHSVVSIYIGIGVQWSIAFLQAAVYWSRTPSSLYIMNSCYNWWAHMCGRKHTTRALFGFPQEMHLMGHKFTFDGSEMRHTWIW